jgi:hypothetical protein
MVNYSPSPYPSLIKGEVTVLEYLNRDLGSTLNLTSRHCFIYLFSSIFITLEGL